MITKITIIKNKLVHAVLFAGLIKVFLSPLSMKLVTGIVFLSVLMLTAVYISQYTKWSYKPFIAGFIGTAVYNVGLLASMSLPINLVAIIIPALEVGVIAIILSRVIK